MNRRVNQHLSILASLSSLLTSTWRKRPLRVRGRVSCATEALEDKTLLSGVAGFEVTESGGGTTVDESGATDIFEVVLLTRPASDVVLKVTSDDTGEAVVDKAELTFTSGNWDTAQSVTVTGVDDVQVDGDQTPTVTISVDDDNSDDAFDGLGDQTVSVTVEDDDTAGVDLSLITLVKQLDPYGGNNRYADVWGEGDYAYLGSFAGSGVAIFDVSDPESAFLAAQYNPETGGQFKDLKVVDGIGYFASDNDGGLHIVDLADPTNPTLITTVTAGDGGYDHIHNVSIAGGFLYQADSRTNVVKVFDVSTPAAPSFVRDITTSDPRFIHDITAIGDRLYTAGWGGKTDIYDVSDVGTQAPVLLGAVDSGRNSHSNFASPDGSLLVVAREIRDGDIRIYDISDPAAPVLESTINADSLGIDAFSPHNPFLVGDQLFVSWYQAGLQVFDVGDPATPVRLGQYDTFSPGVSGFDGNWGVYPGLGPDRILLSDLDSGLFIVDSSGIPDQATVGESGTTDAFDVVLHAAPLTDVVLTITTGDDEEATVDKSSLTFTPANWDTAQTVTITGVDDSFVDGDQTTDITISVSQADSDDAFDALPNQTISVTTTDDDSAGFTVTQTGGTTEVDESGTEDMFDVVLDAAPVSDVVLSIAGGDPGEAVVAPATLTFTPSDWDTPQPVTITGIDDPNLDGDQESTVTISVIDGSSDDTFDAVEDQGVLVITTDDEVSLILDNSGPEFSLTGNWQGGVGGHLNGIRYISSTRNGPATHFARWTTDVGPGLYQISASWAPAAGNQQAGNRTAGFRILDGTTDLGTVFVNQKVLPDDRTDEGTPFDDLGLFAISDTTLTVELSNLGTAFTIADAVRLERVETVGISISETGGTTNVAEGGATDQYQFTLDSVPTDDVVITVTPDAEVDLGAGIGNPVQLTFTPANAFVPQVVTVTADDDADDEGPHTSVIAHSVSSADSDYDGLAVRDVIVNITDNDGGGAATIIDNTHPEFSTVGNWQGNSNSGHEGNHVYISSSRDSITRVAQWTADIVPGDYRVSVSWVGPAGNNNAGNKRADYVVKDDTDTLATVRLNQRMLPDDRSDGGSLFEDLGVFTFTTNTLMIELGNMGTGFTVADAIRFELIP